MGELVLSLIPLAIGVVMSPLAIIALVAVLLSRRARVNGVAFLGGWVVAVVILLAGSSLVLALLHIDDVAQPPSWVSIVRLVLVCVLSGAAVWIIRRGRAHKIAMAKARTPTDIAEAAPQLPSWLQKIESFTPLRSFMLGLGIFILNPVDASCAILASLDVRLAEVTVGQAAAALVGFAVVSVVPIAVPVVLLLVKGERAQPTLATMRKWIAHNTSLLNAALLLVIAVLQLQKALSALLGAP